MNNKLLAAASLMLSTHLYAAGAISIPELKYTATRQGLYEIPLAEKTLPTVEAEKWIQVSKDAMQLEGPSFDREGNLYFVEVFKGEIWKADKSKRLSLIVPPNNLGSAGLAIHKDGRLFVAGLGNFKDTGNLVSYKPDGTSQTYLIDSSKGYLIDDLVFDQSGDFYFTDFRGTSTEKSGGVYYVPPDLSTIVPILPHLGIANGIALSPDGKTLWVTELATGLLHRVELKDPKTVAPFGAVVAYRFNGPCPDSMRTDSDGNLYVAMYSQGRILVLNPNGTPIGQVLIPHRESGNFLRTTSLAFKPGTNEIYIVASDGEKGMGSAIFRAKAFATGTKLYSHQ